MKRYVRLGSFLAAPLLIAAGLVTSVAAPAAADPVHDCDWVPLKYSKSYTSAGEHWRVKANLKVYDRCEAGTFTGKVYIDWRGDTSEGDISPYRARLRYKTGGDVNYNAEGVTFTRLSTGDGWRPYRLTTDDIDLNGGYFAFVEIRWYVSVDGKKYYKTVTCDRIYDHGDNAYSCH